MNTSLTQDILAKLLATENITVTRSNVPTASFDIKNRVLSLPRWKNLTSEIEEMLILHEVGHALYTTESGYGIVHTTKRHLRGYANIIEDVRIEKKMKDRYPGSRKSFNSGYTQLNERDFFGVKDKDFDDLLLIDKINLYYKAGYSCGVTFTAEEYVFVQKADKCVTEKDVIKLAQEIFDFSKGKYLEEESEEQKVKRKMKITDDHDGDPYEDYEMSDEDEFEEDNDDIPELQPETDNAFEEALKECEDRETRTYYLQPKFEVENDDAIVPYKTIIKELSETISEESWPFLKQRALSFKTESNNIVNYLVKEFEMRKSASAYKRTKISKLGQLDMRKLYAYQLKDDLFKQISTVQEGKNHGMIFLLDWSGSMINYMHETVEQVINLAMFCQKIRIPYQVLAFSDGYSRSNDYSHKPIVVCDDGIDNMQGISLLELFSNKMSTRDFNKSVELLLNSPWNRDRRYGLNGTPLNHALLYMANYIGKYIKVNDIEKMNLIILTDGESNTMHHYDYNAKNKSGISNGMTYVTENGAATRVNATTILRDHITRKEYIITDHAPEQTALFLNVIKDRYNIRTTAFFVAGSSYRTIERFVKYNMATEAKHGEIYRTAIEIQSKLRKEKAVVLKNVPGRDETYIILSTNKIVDEDLDDVKSDMSASQISKQLTRMFSSRKSSRVVLNSFIGVVA